MSSLEVTDVDITPEQVTADLYKDVFRDHAARVVVVTAEGEDGPAGLTATSLTSVSLQPPMVSFAVARSASAWRTLSRSGALAVHLLGDDQHRLAEVFATSGIDRFAGLRWRPGRRGEPLIDNCAAYLCCQVVQHVPAGDHVIVLARVAEAKVVRSGAPLIYHDGAFASVGQYAAGTPRQRTPEVTR